jgi:hypothetical protein
MKSFRSYLSKLDRQATAEPRQRDRKKLVRSILATAVVAGSQFVSAISATANTPPNPDQPSPLLPTRILLNGSFETPAKSNGAGHGVNEAYNNTPPIIWRTTEPGNANGTYKDQLEIWRGINTSAGGLNASGAEGSQYAEINASTNASIYQDLCVMPAETVGWSLKHAARKNGSFASGNPTNIMQVSITDPTKWANSKTPPAAQANAYYSSLGDYSSSGVYPTNKITSGKDPITSARPFIASNYNDGWKAYSGSWTSTNTEAKLLRFAFGAIQGSNNISYGNFIDDVKLSLSPLIDFLPSDGSKNVNISSTPEGNDTNYYYLSLRINGEMLSNGKVSISLTGLNSKRSFRIGDVRQGTSTSKVTGLQATKDVAANIIYLEIPSGTYDANNPAHYIHIPIDFSDKVKQPNDQLTFTLDSVDPKVNGGLAIKSSRCGADIITVNTELIDEDVENYQKRVELPVRIAAH